MAKISKREQYHAAFAPRFRSAYLVEFGEHASAEIVEQAWRDVVAPVLDASWEFYLGLNVKEATLFVALSTFKAVHNLREAADLAQLEFFEEAQT